MTVITASSLQRGPGTGLSPAPSASRIPIGQADFPAPFPGGLEFNPPVHGTWNIVHIGMLLPQAHQIYVCSENCMRGVVMTAAEMGAMDRFSCVTLEERDLYTGNLEEITLEGITDVLNKLADRGTRPRAVLVFPVCLHHFMGCDLQYVYGELERRFPSVIFLRCWMDPIMRQSGPTPDQKLRRAMMDLTESTGASPQTAPVLSFLGDLIALDPESELFSVIGRAAGSRAGAAAAGQIQDCGSLDAYIGLGEAGILACRSVTAYPSLIETAGRLHKIPLYLPLTYSFSEIRRLLGITALLVRHAAAGTQKELPEAVLSYARQGRGSLSEAEEAACEAALTEAGIDPEAEEAACGEALGKTLSLIGETPVAVDSVAFERPLGLCRLLISHGFNVREVYLDAFSEEEEGDYLWLKEHSPSLIVCSTIRVEGRVLHGGALGEERRKILAAGPKAAWFNGTPHFVNMVYGGGLWGYSGIRKLADLLCDAYLHEKDTRELVPRKGLGCACVL